MSFKIIAVQDFEKELKRLSKKYHSLKYDYLSLIEALEENPLQGTSIGKDCYKIRMPIKKVNNHPFQKKKSLFDLTQSTNLNE